MRFLSIIFLAWAIVIILARSPQAETVGLIDRLLRLIHIPIPGP